MGGGRRDKFSADKTILHLVGWLMKEMLEANIPIHFFTSYKSAMPAAPRQETASVQRELQENPESLWCYYSLLSHTSQCIHIKRIQKVYHLVGSLLSSVLRYHAQGIAY